MHSKLPRFAKANANPTTTVPPETSNMVPPRRLQATSEKENSKPSSAGSNYNITNKTGLTLKNTRRRSKSFTDLNNLNSRKVDFVTMRKKILEETEPKKKAAVLIKTLSKVVTKKDDPKPIAGQKRQAAAPSAGPSKPKLSKWDYKGRLNQELEKSAQMKVEMNEIQKELDALKLKSGNIKDELQSNLDEVTNSYRSLKKEYEEFMKTQEKQHEEWTKTLEKQHEECMKLTNELEKLRGVNKECSSIKAENAELRRQLQAYQQERRVLHNKIQDLKGNIRVFCRVRPVANAEEEYLLQCLIEVNNETEIGIRPSRLSASSTTGKITEKTNDFSFDRAFGPESKQEEIFEDLSQLVQSALDGYDVCVFAYGQTGSGKTYTMQGGSEPEQQGMIPRTVDRIYEAIEVLKLSGWDYQVHVSFLEIYNEKIRDLLNINSTLKMDICFNEGRGTTVSHLTIKSVKNPDELKMNMTLAQRNRATAATNFNEHSSRSHAVTKIYIEGYHMDQGIRYRGSINLVDLAGSESAKASTIGERLTETKNINKSLAALANVLMALKSKHKHIPYRDSKLTYLLQSSLGGNSKTLMITNISPFEDNYMESLSSLRFASKVKEVKTQDKKNKQLIRSNSMQQV